MKQQNYLLHFIIYLIFALFPQDMALASAFLCLPHTSIADMPRPARLVSLSFCASSIVSESTLCSLVIQITTPCSHGRILSFRIKIWMLNFCIFWWNGKYLPNIHPCREDDDQEEAATQPETNEAEIWLKLALLHLLIRRLGNIFQWMIHFTSETRFVLICLDIFVCFFPLTDCDWGNSVLFSSSHCNVASTRPADSRRKYWVVDTIYNLFVIFILDILFLFLF